jgi:septum formation protein
VNGTVAWRFGQRVWQNVSVATLQVRPLSDEFIATYLAAEGEALLATVGAYRLEGAGVHLFQRVEGEHSTILGLAMLPLLAFLRQHGVLRG